MMDKINYSDKIITDLKESGIVMEEEISSIRRVFRLSEGKITVRDENSFTIDRFIEKSLDYLCTEHMTICRNHDEMADVMTLKRHLDYIRSELTIDETLVDRFNSLYI